MFDRFLMKEVNILYVCQQIIGFCYKPLLGAFGFSSITLIKTKKKTILFDVGNYGVRNEVLNICNNIKIDEVFISHLHYDHCANLDLFSGTNTPIYVENSEVEDYFNPIVGDRKIDTDLFPGFKNIYKQINLTTFDREIQLDEGVYSINTPGHTNSHCSLVCKKNNRKLLIAGDAIKTQSDYFEVDSFDNAQNPRKFIESKKIIREQKYEWIIPGHDKIFKPSDEVDSSKEILKSLSHF